MKTKNKAVPLSPLSSLRLCVSAVHIFFASFATAGTVSHWTQNNAADFNPGTFHNVVATSLGDLKLSRAVKELALKDDRVSAVYAMAQTADGSIYAGTGPQGVLLKINDGKVATAATFDDGSSIFSLAVDSSGRLLVGTGGTQGRVYRVDKAGDKPKVIFDGEGGVQYVWALAGTPDGNVYVATGPNGQLFELKPDGSHNTVLETSENNLLSMVSDGKDLLYIGTDPNGLVYRINRKTRESFVLYDCNESEVSALALDRHGNLYAGTAEATPGNSTPADDSASNKDKTGRPEGAGGGVPIEAKPPTNPAPPAKPNPNPGEPSPIPKKMMILADDPLDAAKPPSTIPDAKPDTPPAPPQQAINANDTGQPKADGNAIYKIAPDGFVTEIFRQPALIFSIVVQDDALIVGTGSDGDVYQVNPAAEETSVVAKLNAKQVTCLMPTLNGRVMLGTANTGGLAEMSAGYALNGTYTSAVQDATQISKFGKMQLHGSLPDSTGVTVATRSGNVKDPAQAQWSPWSAEQSATEFLDTHTPAARYFQYRLTFNTRIDTNSPVVANVDQAYLMPNLSPVLKSVKVTLGGKNSQPPTPDAPDNSSPATPPIPAGRIQTVAWEASDPNSDSLQFSVYERPGSSGPWILIKDKIKENSYEWDTRTVADGRYQVKVTASDVAANPVGQGKITSRISDAVLVDNTPPVIGDVVSHVEKGDVDVKLKAVDATSTVSAVDFSLDSSQDWQAATPSDTMFDGPEAPAQFRVAGLSVGSHQIAVRATDVRGNQSFMNVTVTIPPR